MRLTLLLCLVVLPQSTVVDPVADAARAFLASLDDAQRAQTCFTLADPLRLQWGYLPGQRAGLKLRDMTVASRGKAHELLRAALSTQGYLKVTGIMALEVVLKELERAAGGDGATRDPEQYAFAFFGEPVAGKPFAWRMEGHHIVLTWSNVPGASAFVTPQFFGTHPAAVPSGPSAGLEILAREDELALALMLHFDSEERALAMLPGAVPADVLAGPGRATEKLLGEGVAWTELDESARHLLALLLAEAAADYEAPVAARLLERLRAVPPELCRFAWCGPMDRRAVHYWRVVVGRMILEYDNREAGAGHVHRVWRDLDHDHGGDVLRRHIEEQHGGK